MKGMKGAIASVLVHGAVLAALLLLSATRHSTPQGSDRPAYELPSQVVWLSVPGPGAGGGGGGKEEQSPARAALVKGADAETMPAAPRAAPDASEVTPPPPVSLPDVPIQTLGASELTALGLIEAGADSLSSGNGTRDGVGTGDGNGAGPGSRDGIGPGRDGNIGGRVYQPGSGVTMPVAVYQEKPRYTIEAMRARIQGAVIIECVVQPTGVCEPLRVLRSLDARLGLDEQALRAVAAWRFSPGTRGGKPVAVLVTIQLGFSIN